MSSQASWWVKVARARKHLTALKRAVRAYAKSGPYEPVVVIEDQDDQEIARVRVRITRQPDDEIAAIVGDVVHNLRSALDHIICSLAPTNRYRSAAFPILTANPWLKEGRRYVIRDSNARRTYSNRVRGIEPAALNIITAAQPFNDGPSARSHVLAVLNDLENADKHRNLIVTATVLADAWVSIRTNRWSGGVGFPGEHYGATYVMASSIPRVPQEGLPTIPFDLLDAETRHWIENRPPEGTIEAEAIAAVAVYVESVRSRREEDTIAFLELAAREVSKVLSSLEPFVKSGRAKQT